MSLGAWASLVSCPCRTSDANDHQSLAGDHARGQRLVEQHRADCDRDHRHGVGDQRELGRLDVFIGLFYELTPPLEKGANEVWMAISESFGGWGLAACDVEAIDASRTLELAKRSSSGTS